MNDRVSAPPQAGSRLRSPTLGMGMLLAIVGATLAVGQDLTGTWRADDGATYQVRHVGNEVFWHGRDSGGGSEWSNIFHATQQGSSLRGRWADVPPGRLRNHGQLEIVIRNADRMDAVTLNGEPYGRTWTREGAGGAPPATSGTDPGMPPPAPDLPSSDASWSSNASVHRGSNGERFNYRCPGGGSPSTAYGTDVYTDDSSICVAAVHAGAISFREGGTITIEILPGRDSYTGSDRNGVSTNSWSSYVGSFRVVGGGATGSQEVQREIFVQLPPPTPGLPIVEASWSSNASVHRGRNGERFNYRCPAGGSPGTAYGTDVYTDDSSICVAAVHAGAISFREGGTITIEILPGRDSYTGSDRNGVTTSSWSSYVGSFRVVGTARGNFAIGDAGVNGVGRSEHSAGGGETAPDTLGDGVGATLFALAGDATRAQQASTLPAVGAAHLVEGVRDLASSSTPQREQFSAQPGSPIGGAGLSALRLGYEAILDVPTGCGMLTIDFDVESVPATAGWHVDVYVTGRASRGRLGDVVTGFADPILVDSKPIERDLSNLNLPIKLPFPTVQPAKVRAELLRRDPQGKGYDLVAVKEATTERPGPNLSFSARFFGAPANEFGAIPMTRIMATVTNAGNGATNGSVYFVSGMLFENGRHRYKTAQRLELQQAFDFKKILPPIPAGDTVFVDQEFPGLVWPEADWSTAWVEIKDMGCSNERDITDNFRHAPAARPAANVAR